MIRRPPRSTLSSSSAASDVYKRQVSTQSTGNFRETSMRFWLGLVIAICASGLHEDATLHHEVERGPQIERLATDQELAKAGWSAVQACHEITSLSARDRAVVYRMASVRPVVRNDAISLVELNEGSSSAVGTLLSAYNEQAAEGSEDSIMASLSELQDKISAEQGIDSDNHARVEHVCHQTSRAMEAVIGEEASTQSRLQLSEHQLRDLKAVDERSYTDSRENERALSADLHRIQMETAEMEESYIDRRRQRIKDLEVAESSTHFVCTFSAFVDDSRCVNRAAVAAIPLPSATSSFGDLSERQLKQEMESTIVSSQDAWAARIEQDQADIRAGTLPSHGATMEASSLIELSQRSAKADRSLRARLMSQGISEAVRGPATAVLLAVEAGDFEKAKTLLDLVLDLVTQVRKEQEADNRVHQAGLVELLESRKAAEHRLWAEQTKQSRLEESMGTLSASIDSTRVDYFHSAGSMSDAGKRHQENDASCEAQRQAYQQRKVVADQELLNINKLRSLLQVLGGEGVPECGGDMNSCTAAEQGMCIRKNADENICACEPEYYGAACELKKCQGLGGLLYKHTEAAACSSETRGKCDPETGSCSCNSEYKGDACQTVKQCPGGGNCNNHGKCDTHSGVCDCFHDWFGVGCQEKKCPGPMVGGSTQLYTGAEAQVCSGHGICISSTGQCGCQDGYEGSSCQLHKCEDNCSGNGECMRSTGSCSCRSEWYGPTCAFKECPGDCSGVGGKCNRLAGVCVCNPQYSGPACEKTTTCEERLTSFQDWSFWKPGWSKCPSGWLMTGLVTGTCTGIHCIEKAVCAKPCLGKTPLGLSQCYQENWWESTNQKGWSRCREGYFMVGMYRNTCNSVYCIEMALCCAIREAEYDGCQESSWFNTIKLPNAKATTPGNTFLTGLYRAGITAKLSDVRSAASCHFKSTKAEID
eukprot:TRINITY_DN11563_c0_g1_i2.p1 TRINITY_DN11563_c0_g1~~TRINITY_DN11563_c0_g1_i2.p1  ORF type:complete len:934 (+),score=205.32 TRINITY_DN11563_c0_g1_i2:137-2938(+)